MTDMDVTGAVTFIYLGASLFYLGHLVFRSERVGKGGSFLALIGLLAQTAAIAWRWVESYNKGIGHAPLSNLYESLVFFAWTTVLIYLIVERRWKARTLGTFVLPIATFILASTSLTDQEIRPLVPALQSNWLTSHVITCFLGYAAFAVAFSTSIMYLLKLRSEKSDAAGRLVSRFPGSNALDEFTYKSISFGFPLLTAGILTGAAWAQYAWGSYWSWDPKETWSLIVWFIYAIYLHARIIAGWRGRRAAIISILGFIATLFCYMGVNLWLSGLHSYGSG